MSDQTAAPSFISIHNFCEDAELPIYASELHGLICGVLAVTDEKNAALQALETLLSENAAEDIGIPQEVTDLIDSSLQQLADPGFSFQLLLPEEENSLGERTKALGLWAQGFVSGLGEGGLQLSEDDQAELSEIIADLTSIAQIDTDDVGDSEDEAVALTELEEYLRVAAMTVYTDSLLQDKNIVNSEKSEYLH